MKKFLLNIYSKILYFFIVFFIFLKTEATVSLHDRGLIGKMAPVEYMLPVETMDPVIGISNFITWFSIFLLSITGIYFLVGLYFFLTAKKDEKRKERGKKYMIRTLKIAVIIFLLRFIIVWGFDYFYRDTYYLE